ncbi:MULTISPECIES: hypothetical protein [unclassified Sporosarcina]|uniref:hypothetical protein n=1 Tax=unclassified Sporosarcina TaxID=2647733 RepID=UPI001A9124F5|nr:MULTISPECIES: hypothetical protein [unclassified Sporosarcina]MBO0587583.1 hypothetical protein [Sporosarcina sp. E16_8]MBO0602429.1 hypothetical protein [Sporosarcina sp. E16_3]
MRMLTENSIMEYKMRSTSIERFRYGQNRKSVEFSKNEDETSVTWAQIIKHIGFFLAAGTFFLFIIFSIALLSFLI